MRIGLYWVYEPDKWVQHVATAVTSSSVSQDAELVCFSTQNADRIQKISRNSDLWAYQTINDLCDVYRSATRCGMDFAVINFGRGLPTDLGLLQKLLASTAIQNCIFSMRIAEISGVGMQNSPRLPFVDDHFVILNVWRARERKFFERNLIHASHFSNAGQRHAELASMIEYALDEDELNNHFVAHASRNQYGQITKLNPLPFNLCEATGFLTCYPEFQLSLTNLLEYNLARLQPRQQYSPGFRYALKRGYWYFRFEPWTGRFVSTTRRVIHDIGKYEFKKRYDDENQ